MGKTFGKKLNFERLERRSLLSAIGVPMAHPPVPPAAPAAVIGEMHPASPGYRDSAAVSSMDVVSAAQTAPLAPNMPTSPQAGIVAVPQAELAPAKNADLYAVSSPGLDSTSESSDSTTHAPDSSVRLDTAPTDVVPSAGTATDSGAYADLYDQAPSRAHFSDVVIAGAGTADAGTSRISLEDFMPPNPESVVAASSTDLSLADMPAADIFEPAAELSSNAGSPLAANGATQIGDTADPGHTMDRIRFPYDPLQFDLASAGSPREGRPANDMTDPGGLPEMPALSDSGAPSDPTMPADFGLSADLQPVPRESAVSAILPGRSMDTVVPQMSKIEPAALADSSETVSSSSRDATATRDSTAGISGNMLDSDMAASTSLGRQDSAALSGSSTDTSFVNSFDSTFFAVDDSLSAASQFADSASGLINSDTAGIDTGWLADLSLGLRASSAGTGGGEAARDITTLTVSSVTATRSHAKLQTPTDAGEGGMILLAVDDLAARAGAGRAAATESAGAKPEKVDMQSQAAVGLFCDMEVAIHGESSKAFVAPVAAAGTITGDQHALPSNFAVPEATHHVDPPRHESSPPTVDVPLVAGAALLVMVGGMRLEEARPRGERRAAPVRHSIDEAKHRSPRAR